MCVRDSVCACMRTLKLSACVYSLHLCRLTETGQSDRAPSASVIARTFRTAWTADDDDDAVLPAPARASHHPHHPHTPVLQLSQQPSLVLSLARITSLSFLLGWVAEGLSSQFHLRGLGACMTLKTFATWFELGLGQVICQFSRCCFGSWLFRWWCLFPNDVSADGEEIKVARCWRIQSWQSFFVATRSRSEHTTFNCLLRLLREVCSAVPVSTSLSPPRFLQLQLFSLFFQSSLNLFEVYLVQ